MTIVTSVSGGFFDNYSRFSETSLTGADDGMAWINRRHRVLIEGCAEAIRDHAVLDFGSHDGRWALAAILAGAKHVTCVEPDEGLNSAAHDNLSHYGCMDRATLVQSDTMSYLSGSPAKAQTAFLFGMLTLISEQPVLFGQLRRLGVDNLVIDTHVIEGETKPVFQPFRAMTQTGNAIIADRTGHNGWMMGMVPSLSALLMMLHHYGYEAKVLDWSSWLDHPITADYRSGRRVSVLATTG